MTLCGPTKCCGLTKAQATSGAGAIVGAIGLLSLVYPELLWKLHFYPTGTAAGGDQWLFTVRCLGAALLGFGLMLIKMRAAALLAAGLGLVASVVYHGNYKQTPAAAAAGGCGVCCACCNAPLVLGVALAAVGACNKWCCDASGECGGAASVSVQREPSVAAVVASPAPKKGRKQN